jgi:hypothetical protein
VSDDEHLDREELHCALREEDLMDFFGGLSGNGLVELDNSVGAFGKEILEAVNREQIDRFQPPLDGRCRAVGYLALLYEAENNTQLENEVPKFNEGMIDTPEASSG